MQSPSGTGSLCFSINPRLGDLPLTKKGEVEEQTKNYLLARQILSVSKMLKKRGEKGVSSVLFGNVGTAKQRRWGQENKGVDL